MSRSLYHIQEVIEDTVFITDQGGDKSVTNDAENVVKELAETYGSARIIYQDSDGQWGELLHDGTEFKGFGRYEGWVPR